LPLAVAEIPQPPGVTRRDWLRSCTRAPFEPPQSAMMVISRARG
jgi:hypothetical protein